MNTEQITRGWHDDKRSGDDDPVTLTAWTRAVRWALATPPAGAQEAPAGQEAQPVGYADATALNYLQEPGGWCRVEGAKHGWFKVPLYAAPPQAPAAVQGEAQTLATYAGVLMQSPTVTQVMEEALADYLLQHGETRSGAAICHALLFAVATDDDCKQMLCGHTPPSPPPAIPCGKVCGDPEKCRQHGCAAATYEAPAGQEAQPVVEVTREDANNYCRILTVLGMEEEGDPVAEVERMKRTLEAYQAAYPALRDRASELAAAAKPAAVQGEAQPDEPLYLVMAGGDAFQSEIVPESKLDDAYLLTQWCSLDDIDPEQRADALAHFHDDDSWTHEEATGLGPRVKFSVSFEDGWVEVIRLPRSAAPPQAPVQVEWGRAEWIAAAERVYMACGDDEQQARNLATYQATQQDWFADDIADPYEAALEDIEGRSPPQATAAVQGEAPNPWADLWYFVMDEAPMEFERIVTTYSPAMWMSEAHKLMRAKYPAPPLPPQAALAQRNGGGE